MEKVTYIIPLHKYNKKIEALFNKALESVEKVEGNGDTVCIVGPQKVVDSAKKFVEGKNFSGKKIDYVVNDQTDFCSQINKAAFACLTPFFSVLEFDDEYMPYWNRVAQEYAAAENASIVLPITQLVENSAVVSLANEIVWTPSFVQDEDKEFGVVNSGVLDGFMDFNVTGALIRTEDFITLGGLKPSLKIASWYEFLLRACYNSKKVYVVPKIGYSHTIGREDSYSETMAKELKQEEGSWLIKTAKQEYFFKQDRNKKFGED